MVSRKIEAKPMKRDRFYGLLALAREGQATLAPSADADVLREILEEKSDKQVLAFILTLRIELASLNRWDIWAAGYVAAGGMSDDAFDYFRAWLVGKGRQAVDTALDAPDALAEFIETDYVENEDLLYLIPEILEERGIVESFDLLREAMPLAGEFDVLGEMFDEDTVDALHPHIAAQVARFQ